MSVLATDEGGMTRKYRKTTEDLVDMKFFEFQPPLGKRWTLSMAWMEHYNATTREMQWFVRDVLNGTFSAVGYREIVDPYYPYHICARFGTGPVEMWLWMPYYFSHYVYPVGFVDALGWTDDIIGGVVVLEQDAPLDAIFGPMYLALLNALKAKLQTITELAASTIIGRKKDYTPPAAFIIPSQDKPILEAIGKDQHNIEFQLWAVIENQDLEQGVLDIVTLGSKIYDLFKIDPQISHTVEDTRVTLFHPTMEPTEAYVRHWIQVNLLCRLSV